jgi:ATP-dependent Lhr-like helicase
VRRRCCASACRPRRSRSRRSRAFWSGARTRAGLDCTIIDTGHRRARDLALEVPDSPLEAVMSAEVWEQVYRRLAELIEAHRTTLIFVNTRGWPSG